MRTTLSIGDDVLAAAKHLADREQKSVGEVIAELARQGLSRSQQAGRTPRNRMPMLAKGKNSSPVTLVLVNQLRHEQPGRAFCWTSMC